MFHFGHVRAEKNTTNHPKTLVIVLANSSEKTEDAKNIDFDDTFIYSEVSKKIYDRKIKMVQMLREEALIAFEIWDNKVDKIKY